jgi:hypothetical protein
LHLSDPDTLYQTSTALASALARSPNFEPGLPLEVEFHAEVSVQPERAGVPHWPRRKRESTRADLQIRHPATQHRIPKTITDRRQCTP